LLTLQSNPGQIFSSGGKRAHRLLFGPWDLVAKSLRLLFEQAPGSGDLDDALPDLAQQSLVLRVSVVQGPAGILGSIEDRADPCANKNAYPGQL